MANKKNRNWRKLPLAEGVVGKRFILRSGDSNEERDRMAEEAHEMFKMVFKSPEEHDILAIHLRIGRLLRDIEEKYSTGYRAALGGKVDLDAIMARHQAGINTERNMLILDYFKKTIGDVPEVVAYEKLVEKVETMKYQVLKKQGKLQPIDT